MINLKNKLLFAILFTFIIISINNINYAAIGNHNTYYDSIVGYAYENIDDTEIEEAPKLENVIIDLYDSDDNYVTSTTTDENGKYKFENLPSKNYTVKFTWGKVDENDINNIATTNDVKKIQKILKYNSQDYTPQYKEFEGTTEDVQIALVIDKSGSMYGSRLEQAKQLATMIVDSLLRESQLGPQVNVEISVVSFDDRTYIDSQLSTDSDALSSAINSIYVDGSTNILDALKTAVNDVNDFNKENRFIFLLSDGIDNCNSSTSIKEYIHSLLEENIFLYSLYIGSNPNDVIDYLEETTFKYVDPSNLHTVIENIVNEFIDFLQVTLGYEEVKENEDRRNTVNENFLSIQYNNTAIFQAIDMDVTEDNVEKFKNYAKLLSEATYMTGYSTKICKITDPPNDTAQSESFNGPNLILKMKPTANLQNSLSITEFKITAQNGTVIGSKSGTPNDNIPLTEYLDINNIIHGSEVQLEYTVNSKNLTNIENNYYSKLTFLCFIPTGFSYQKDSITLFSGVNNIVVSELTKNNIGNQNILKCFQCGNINELSATNLYKEITTGNKSALLITINFDDNQFTYNDSCQFKFRVHKLLSTTEDFVYNERLEVFQYKNTAFRRMQKVSTEYTTGLTTTSTLVAGNGDYTEEDTTFSSNTASIIPPTGKDKRMFHIYTILGLLFITEILIVLIKLRKTRNL